MPMNPPRNVGSWSPPTSKETTHIRALPVTSALSECCKAPIAHDATRSYCTRCTLVVGDLNDSSVVGRFYLCTDCGGGGAFDDVSRCATCEETGIVEA